MTRLSNIFLRWLPLASVIVILTGFIYVAVQQNYRQSLNDPQIAMVMDGQNLLLSGRDPVDVVPRGTLFDIEKSLSTFIAVYDNKYVSLESSGYLENKPLQPPTGVFEYAKEHGEDRVTWQPNANTRIAMVVRFVGDNSGRFVIAGRNMKEVESRVESLTKMMFLALLASLVISFVLYVFADYLGHK